MTAKQYWAVKPKQFKQPIFVTNKDIQNRGEQQIPKGTTVTVSKKYAGFTINWPGTKISISRVRFEYVDYL
jgi:hypothetical protein